MMSFFIEKKTKIGNFADNKTGYSCGIIFQDVTKKPEASFENITRMV